MSIFKPVTVINPAPPAASARRSRACSPRTATRSPWWRGAEKEMILLATELAVSCKYKPHVITADLQRTDAPAPHRARIARARARTRNRRQ